MHNVILDGLAVAYAMAGIICCLAYIPTIRDLYLGKKESANSTTYFLWTITASITLLYSIFILPDLLFILISIANFILCLFILILSSTRIRCTNMGQQKDDTTKEHLQSESQSTNYRIR